MLCSAEHVRQSAAESPHTHHLQGRYKTAVNRGVYFTKNLQPQPPLSEKHLLSRRYTYDFSERQILWLSLNWGNK